MKNPDKIVARGMYGAAITKRLAACIVLILAAIFTFIGFMVYRDTQKTNQQEKVVNSYAECLQAPRHIMSGRDCIIGSKTFRP